MSPIVRSAFLLVAAGLSGLTALADVVSPITYSAPNGGQGAFPYFDDTYIGPCRSPYNVDILFCDQYVPYSPLSGGHGQLTDGVAVDLNWWRYPNTWVGWLEKDYTLAGAQCVRPGEGCLPGLGAPPEVQFYFTDAYSFQLIQIHVDDSDGYGGVSVPLKVEVSDGSTTIEYSVDDPPGPRPAWLTFDAAGLTGSSLLVRLFFRTAWVMVDEFRFYADVTLPQPIPPDALFPDQQLAAQVDYDALVKNPEPPMFLLAGAGLGALMLGRRVRRLLAARG